MPTHEHNWNGPDADRWKFRFHPRKAAVPLVCCALLVITPVVIGGGEGAPQPVPDDEPMNVSLTPQSWNDTATTPSISPNICQNAQAEYTKAKFKATVSPKGARATVAGTSGPVSVSPSNVTDGTIVTVTATAGTPGPYVLTIVHGQDITVKNTAGGTVFKLTFTNVGLTTGPTTPSSPAGATKTFYLSTAGTTPPSTFNTSIGMNLALVNGPASFPAFTQTADWTFKMDTVPAGAYGGKVRCPTTITATTSKGFVSTSGEMAALGIGASTAAMNFADQINISGLAGGNGAISRPVSSSAPTFLFVPVDLSDCAGTTTWTNANAQYSVGTVVDVQDTLTMSGTRGGALPVAVAAAAGRCDETGFTSSPGAFSIMK